MNNCYDCLEQKGAEKINLLKKTNFLTATGELGANKNKSMSVMS